ncbi:hypothetical protein B9Z55_003432 [Caenorhabditis nigoni]|uniref:Uncharacterized protein n=1 Tax=Caenorhabditis nigoni TaxID=1611254 RepID=A0A2G5VQR5_9PELO|nr:hypothetical protein B9Z55_003432 [Caenorhabditis nigoni]
MTTKSSGNNRRKRKIKGNALEEIKTGRRWRSDNDMRRYLQDNDRRIPVCAMMITERTSGFSNSERSR